MMAWQYFAVCLCDFIIFPSVALYLAHHSGNTLGDWKWDPITLKEGGFYHMAMGIVLGVAAWTRGQENLLTKRLTYVESKRNEQSDVELDEDLDPPAHPER